MKINELQLRVGGTAPASVGPVTKDSNSTPRRALTFPQSRAILGAAGLMAATILTGRPSDAIGPGTQPGSTTPLSVSATANDLRLSDQNRRQIEIYVDGDNFTTSPTPALTVLGFSIAIAEDTDLYERHDDGSANPPGGTVEFGDTIVLRPGRGRCESNHATLSSI